jgi:2-haloacid dehalogenase
MQNSIKAIIFDFGGVLLDWNPRYLYQRFFPDRPQAMEDFLNEIDFYAWNAQQDKGRSFAEGIAELSAQFPQYAPLIQAYFDHWEDSISGSIPGTVDILHKLKGNSHLLYGLSNWSAETYPRARERYSFFEWFDDILLSGDVELVKPDPAIFNLLLNKVNLSPSECLMIDDAQANIDSAAELGFSTIHFNSPENLQTELQRLNIL